MKRLISTALALALLGGTSALAAPQDDHGDRDRKSPPPQHEARPAQPTRPAEVAKPQAGPPAQAAPTQNAPQHGQGPGWEHAGGRDRGGPQGEAQAAPQAQPQGGPGWERGARPGNGGPPQGNPNYQDRPGGGRPQGGPDFQGRPNGGPQGGPNYQGRPGSRPPAVRPQDRVNRDFNRPRFDPRRWTFDNHPYRRYHWRGYYALPYGFYSHNWIYGEIMPWGWYTQDYYINDWPAYGLQPPAYGCEWVREGRDAVMVDVYTGRVLSVVYGLFY